MSLFCPPFTFWFAYYPSFQRYLIVCLLPLFDPSHRAKQRAPPNVCDPRAAFRYYSGWLSPGSRRKIGRKLARHSPANASSFGTWRVCTKRWNTRPVSRSSFFASNTAVVTRPLLLSFVCALATMLPGASLGCVPLAGSADYFFSAGSIGDGPQHGRRHLGGEAEVGQARGLRPPLRATRRANQPPEQREFFVELSHSRRGDPERSFWSGL